MSEFAQLVSRSIVLLPRQSVVVFPNKSADIYNCTKGRVENEDPKTKTEGRLTGLKRRLTRLKAICRLGIKRAFH